MITEDSGNETEYELISILSLLTVRFETVACLVGLGHSPFVSHHHSLVIWKATSTGCTTHTTSIFTLPSLSSICGPICR